MKVLVGFEPSREGRNVYLISLRSLWKQSSVTVKMGEVALKIKA